MGTVFAEVSSRTALKKTYLNILNEIYKNKYVRIFIMMILILFNIFIYLLGTFSYWLDQKYLRTYENNLTLVLGLFRECDVCGHECLTCEVKDNAVQCTACTTGTLLLLFTGDVNQSLRFMKKMTIG